MQRGKVLRNGVPTGIIVKNNDGTYHFEYLASYLEREDAVAISVNLPLRLEAYESDILFPFFANMLAEGNVKTLQCRKYRIDENDLFTRLLKTASADTIGAVTVDELSTAEEEGE